MSWFWGGNGKKTEDPLNDLDPGLREYLEKESPVKYTTSTPPPPPEPSRPVEPSPQSDQSDVSNPNSVPRESLFQDGRYGHLWKNYEPLSAVEARTKSDQDKLMDIVEAHNHRKACIGRAALENCALEQKAHYDCMRTGSWSNRFMLCRTENRRLDRCYAMQAKFLKALGYMSTFDGSPEMEERIQMHADSLYHRMLEQERLIEEAKAEGKPIPEFKPVMSRENLAAVLNIKDTKTAPTSAQDTMTGTMSSDAPPSNTPVKEPLRLDQIPETRQKELKRRLEGLSTEEKALELRTFEAEFETAKQVSQEVRVVLEEERKHRLERREKGMETIGDKMKRWWGGW